MSHMDYVDDGSKRMFSRGQALRMQATIAPGGFRAALHNSPGLCPTLNITSTGPAFGTVFCGDQTDYNFRATPLTLGCAGGSIRYQWAASNGWTVTDGDYPDPLIIPSGVGGSTLTLTGTYLSANAHANPAGLPLNTASVVVGYSPAAGTPVFTDGPAMLCPGTSGVFTVAPVPGATGYFWTLPPGFGRLRQNPNPSTTLTLSPAATLVPGVYTLSCQAVANGCALSAVASRSFSVNGGPLLQIVDGDPSQRDPIGVVCTQNRLALQLRPVVPGAFVTATNVTWSPNALATVPVANRVLEYTYFTSSNERTAHRITASYLDACNNRRTTAEYVAYTAPAGTSALTTGYPCAPNRYRPAPPSPPALPYPNPVAGRLQLPGYHGAVVVYNQQGQAVHHLLAPNAGPDAAVDTSTWPDGLYVVTGRNPLGEFVRHNVQVQH